ncbi:MAG: rRNA maturation RNase YbeY [Acidobacteriota bacterium]|nr:rRNA maturation RNase YbeY [Acidobacteriota bacterium]
MPLSPLAAPAGARAWDKYGKAPRPGFRRRIMIEVVNRQRRVPMDGGRWREFTEKALQVVPAGGAGVTVAFVSDRAMRELNRRWRGKRGTTDVLSFPAGQEEFERAEGSSLGDVVISVEQAARQAAEQGLGFENEVEQLILHGLLHLCGYDHEADEGEMNALELRLRRRLGI